MSFKCNRMNKETENPWKVLSAEEVYDNPWIRLTKYDVINPGGGKGIYGKVHFKNHAIGVLALDDHMNTWLVGQYRFVLDAYSWEIPEGGCPLNTSPLESAKRELKEETGFSAARWTEIQTLHLSNSVSDELGYIFVAQNLTAGDAEPEETEDLNVRKLPFEDAYQMVLRGEITDSISIIAILKVKQMIAEDKL